ncbi:MAG: WXG100 family type VII secretion target [Synergistaceae bacterium]|nr:WXG100 family type VII secretion target [Synergistaceae bacterium]MBR1603407.1 WXG100 family type VII secretion target [Synergistaceae bacterium]
MADRIVVTPETLEQRSNELKKAQETQRQSFDTVKSLIDNLVSGWEGEAQQAFMNSYNNNKKTFDEFIVDMGNFAKFMYDFAAAMRLNEKGGVSKAQQL